MTNKESCTGCRKTIDISKAINWEDSKFYFCTKECMDKAVTLRNETDEEIKKILPKGTDMSEYIPNRCPKCGKNDYHTGSNETTFSYFCNECGFQEVLKYKTHNKKKKPQHYGILKIKYKPTGEIKELKLGIHKMSYHNELIFCEAWGYEGGHPTDLNNPDNYEIIEIVKEDKQK